MVASFAASFRVTVLVLATDADVAPPPSVPGADSCQSIEMGSRRRDRYGLIADAVRVALDRDTEGDRALRARLREIGADVVVGLGPWLGIEYRGAFGSVPMVYAFEEDLTQMREIASQSRQGKIFRAIGTWIGGRARAQPDVVISISRWEQRRAERTYPRSRHLVLPFTLPSDEWPVATTTTTGRWVLAAGNFSEDRNAEGLVAVLEELASRPSKSDVRIRIASDAGLHPSLVPFLDHDSVDYAYPAGPLQDHYRQAWAALVPALRVTGQKTTVLQAWSCGCPVVCSSAAAATVGVPEAVASGIDAPAMVDQLLALRNDPPRREAQVRAGFDALAGAFDPAQQDRVLGEVVLGLVAP